MSHQFNWAWHEIFIIRRLVGELPGLGAFQRRLADLTNRSNAVLFDFVEETSTAFESGNVELLLRNDLGTQRRDLRDHLVHLRNGFILDNQDALLNALTAADGIFGPAPHATGLLNADLGFYQNYRTVELSGALWSHACGVVPA